MATLDSNTQASWLSAPSDLGKAGAIVNALTEPVTVEIRNGANTLMGSGTMVAPWAVANANGTVTIGEVNGSQIEVAQAGTPDGSWQCRFVGANGRTVKCGFGLLGSGAEVKWSLSTWNVGDKATIGTVILYATVQVGAGFSLTASMLDATTAATFNAAATDSARASAVVSALSGSVAVEIFDGANVLRGSGTMVLPWATAAGATLTVGEVTAAGINVLSGGVPTDQWYMQFRSVARYVRGSFGLAGSGAQFIWPLSSFDTGSRGTLGTITMVATGAAPVNQPPVIATIPTIDIVQGTSVSIAGFGSDAEGEVLSWLLESGSHPGISVTTSGLLVASPTATVGLSQQLTVSADDGYSAGSAPVNTSLPVITGTPQVGSTLSCSTGAWTGTGTITYAFQWLRSGQVVAGATGSTYLLTASDLGATMTCRVTATIGSLATQVTSGATAAITSPSGSAYDADWAARATVGVNGVFYATNASDTAATQAQFFRNASTPAGRVNLQSAIKRSGSQAVRIDVPNNGGADNGAWVIPIAGGRGPGTTTYYQACIYTDEPMIRIYPEHRDSTGALYEGGWKSVHLGGSRTTGSNQLFEVVVQNTNYRGYPQGYSRNSSGSFPPFDVGVSSPQNNSNLRHHNAVDNGTPTSYGGLDSEFIKRYGPLYTIGSQSSTPNRGDIFAQNLPHPSVKQGSVVWVPNGWTVIEVMVQFGAYNQPASRIKIWAARAGDPEKLIIDMQNWELGQDSAEPLGHTALWLHNYETNKVPNTRGVDTFQVYTEAIMSTQFIPFPTVA